MPLNAHLCGQEGKGGGVWGKGVWARGFLKEKKKREKQQHGNGNNGNKHKQMETPVAVFCCGARPYQPHLRPNGRSDKARAAKSCVQGAEALRVPATKGPVHSN